MNAIEKLQKRLPENIDAALIMSEYNLRYFTSFVSSNGILFLTRDKAVYLTDFRYIEAARLTIKGCDIRLLENRKKQLQELVTETKTKRLGIEVNKLPFATVMYLEEELPEVEFAEDTEFNNLIDKLRMIKTPDEIANIKKAQEITDAAFRHVVDMIKPGIAERDIAIEIEFFMKKNKAQGPSFDLIVVSGEKSSMPHGVPDEHKFKNGDFVTMDIGAIYNGYCSDMTRTVAIGSVTDEQRKVYETVLKAQKEAEQAVKAGVICSNIDKIARDIIYDAGYEGCFGHGLGHSVGLEIHEDPRFSPTCETVTESGMIMTVEPGIYLEGKFGVRIEDLVLVTESGCEIFTQSPHELMIL